MNTGDAAAINPNSTRWAVLKTLRRQGRATVSEVAAQVGVKGVTVRHHLNSLHADGLVEVDEQRQLVGRPVYVYRLSASAVQLFPQAYHILVKGLLAQIRDQLSPDEVDLLIAGLADTLAADLRRQMAGLPPDERRERLIGWLDERGLTARWQETPDGLQLVKQHCPYHTTGASYPELCAIDAALVRAALDAEVVRAACLQEGDPVCALALDSTHSLAEVDEQSGG
jgi:predicted ArsR family transcriptional regulator